MELKNAVAVCLIAMFSATLVLLIARALDLQTASRLEPQLAKIVEELQMIRKSAGIRANADGAGRSDTVDDGLVVYYFHSNTRCPTCRAIESQSHDTVRSDFASQLNSGEVVWKALNYEESAGTELAKKFAIQMPVVVLARMKGGQIEDWKRLDRVWALVGDKRAFAEYLQAEIQAMQGAASPATPAASEAPTPTVMPALDLPIPDAAFPDDTPPPLPVPMVPAAES